MTLNGLRTSPAMVSGIAAGELTFHLGGPAGVPDQGVILLVDAQLAGLLATT